jgi:integrase
MLFATSFAIRLDKSAQLVENKYPIVLQITFDRKVRRKRLGMSATLHQWDFENHEYKKGVHGRREKNEKLEEAEKKALKIYQEHFDGKPFNYKKFVTLFTQKPLEQMTVLDFCAEVSQKFLQNGQTCSCVDYKRLANAIKKVAPNDLTFDEFTEEWLQSFEEYYTSRGTRCYNYMVLLRALFNKAIKRKVADFKNNPFKNPYTNPFGYEFARLKKLKIGKMNPNRIKDLSKAQLMKLADYDPISKKEEEYLDVWWFSFYMFGVNLTDLAKLRRSDIKEGCWFYERSKTGTGLKAGKPILLEALEIIEKYDTGDKYIFPILNNG